MESNFLGFDPVDLIARAFPVFKTESERWETLTASDDADDKSVKVDVRTLITQMASAYRPTEDDENYRQIISSITSDLLEEVSEADELSYLAVML
ncbi:MAG: hypothetical protein MN733_42635, partial [Nitrososphaera sp.]|nr:hypothetical protein [Nitrososphaera sp.]